MKLVIYLAIFLSANLAQAQISLSGIVSDANGPLPGTNIIVKGTTNGTLSDMDGKFSLANVPGDAVLVFSYIGFRTQEVLVNGRTNLVVQMEEEAGGLDEVVVIGYGTQKKENLTGSVDVVSGERLRDRSANNVADLIKGTSPNLNITMNLRGGEPGASSNWNIRGMGSLEGNAAPLILVDGVEMNVNNLDPESIESVSILKDASAASVYGSRAPFGVILITTKKGKKNGNLSVQYTNNLSFDRPIRLPSFENSLLWATAYNQAAANAGINAIYSAEQMERIKGYQEGTFPYEYDPENPINNVFAGRRNGNANNDWPTIIMGNTSFNQKHNLNVSGGTEKSQYFISGGYIEENGLYTWGNDSFKRYNFMTNYTGEINSWIKFNSSIKYAANKSDYPMGITTVGREHIFDGLYTFAPMTPYYNLNGTIQSPLVRNLQSSGRENGFTNDFFITLGGELEPIKGWKTIFTFNHNNQGYRSTLNPKPVPVELGNGSIGNIGKAISGYQTSFFQNLYTMANAVSAYEKNFGKHYLKAMVGYEQEYRYYTMLSGSGSNLISTDVPSISTSLGQRVVSDMSYHWATQGVFGRVNYNYSEKYLVEFSARYNGSSRFSPENRWGFFPSGSIGYAISEEGFWDPIENFANYFKIRASYGSLGNQDVTTSGNHNVRNYRYLSTIPTGSQLNWIIDGERPPYADVPVMISNDLTWETITSFNIGFDAGFIDNRLTMSFDWYNRETTDMVGPAVSLPYQLGSAAPRTNNAALSTKGYELVISWKNNPSPNFGYNASFSLGDNRATVIDYQNDRGLIGTWYPGKRVGEIWGLTSDGLIQTAGEDMPDQSMYHSKWGPGDMKYVDINGDGKIHEGTRTLDDHGDLTVIGNSQPRYNIGITGGINWKQFDFSMFWQGVGRQDYYPGLSSSVFWGMNASWTSSGIFKDSFHLDYWRPENETNILGPNTDGYLPKPYFTVEANKNRQVQTAYLINASYLRLRNIQLGYTFSNELLERIHVSKLRVYVSGENLLLISNVPKVFDPETMIASDPSFGGYQSTGQIYPNTKSVSFGLNLTF